MIEVPQVLIGMLKVKPVLALPDCRYLDRGKGAVNTVTVPVLPHTTNVVINHQLKERESFGLFFQWTIEFFDDDGRYFL